MLADRHRDVKENYFNPETMLVTPTSCTSNIKRKKSAVSQQRNSYRSANTTNVALTNYLNSSMMFKGSGVDI